MFFKGQKVDHSDIVLVHNTAPSHTKSDDLASNSIKDKYVLEKIFLSCSSKVKKVCHSALVLLQNTAASHDVLIHKVGHSALNSI